MLLDKKYKSLFMESNLLPLLRSSNILIVQIKFKYQLFALMLAVLNNSLIRHSFSDIIVNHTVLCDLCQRLKYFHGFIWKHPRHKYL